MIRERRSKVKLEGYYRKFIEEGIIDPNVHPWVAKSWEQSKKYQIKNDKMILKNCLSKEQLALQLAKHNNAVAYLDELSEDIREFLNTYNLSLLLLDENCYVLKSFSLPFYQKTPGEIEGARVKIEDVGTSSISIVHEHKTPFFLYGPEMWVEECQQGDACSAPIMLNGELSYIVTLVAVEQEEIPQSAILSLLLTIKHSMEKYLVTLAKVKAQEAILDAAPFAVYHILSGGEVAYTNKLGQSRLFGIGGKGEGDSYTNLNNVLLNYRHTPVYKGFNGVPSYNKEVTWITPNKTYEDITTVVPLERDNEQIVSSVVAVSMPIEDLRTLVAHTAGYTARYSLGCMVGDSVTFNSIKDKANRLAKNNNHILLQGEAGTGKQRMAHGIHQGSVRVAGPLISVKCGDLAPELLEQELFGVAEDFEVSRPGKIELANGGTLFIDEIEKLPAVVAALLAKALTEKKIQRLGDSVKREIDVRIIAACDSDLKRLSERNVFSKELYDIIGRSVIRVPSLRNRREDIPLLADHIITELATQHQLKPKKILAQTAEKLKEYDWPGNTKQLQAVIEYAFFNTAGDQIKPEDINLMGDVKHDNSWKEEREVFLKAWQAAGGNVSRLANLLDVSRVTLYRYIKKYGLEKA
ncbi:MAG: sigma-54-dependent Fis family transcriptional regulator [Negativicutes bacterium]|nr:sigma-54-dependent Fis family transcriptional regulator [Negativicutes bacterium]